MQFKIHQKQKKNKHIHNNTMQAETLEHYKSLIPKIKVKLKELKSRKSKKIQRINQVADPSSTLVSASECLDNPTIKKENIIKIRPYFEEVVLHQAKLDLESKNNYYRAILSNFKNFIIDQLHLIELTIGKINSQNIGLANKFFEDFSNGNLNDDNKFKHDLEILISTIVLEKIAQTNIIYPQRMNVIIEAEKKKLASCFENIISQIIENKPQPVPSFLNATIIRPDEFCMVGQWVKDQIGNFSGFESIFNTKDNGFSGQEFHKKCDGKGATIVFVEASNGKRFGGYANSPWVNIEKWVKDEKCFVFSLDLKEKYMHKPGNQCSMCGTSKGPVFGGGKFISYYCTPKQLNLCWQIEETYECHPRTVKDILGQENFVAANYEVFLVKQIQQLIFLINFAVTILNNYKKILQKNFITVCAYLLIFQKKYKNNKLIELASLQIQKKIKKSVLQINNKMKSSFLNTDKTQDKG